MIQSNEFENSGLHFQGYSEGGIRTSIICPTLSSMFDMGSTNPHQMQYERLFLTHTHLDHFAGLPYYVSQRSLRNLKPPTIYLSPEIHERVKKLLDLYSELEDFPYKYDLVPLGEGERARINRQYYVQSHPTYHRVVSQGYTVYEERTKLKKEYSHLNGIDLKEMKSRGIAIDEIQEIPVMSFSGDTKIEYVLNHPDVQNSKTLFLECTYLDDKRNVERARNWGHIHLDEIAENAEKFQNERLVLIHFSQRYRFREIRDWVKTKLPKDLLERTILFLPPKTNSNSSVGSFSPPQTTRTI